eukprot:scaffold103755_cov34-Tisochrysis_lutea.AAC.4
MSVGQQALSTSMPQLVQALGSTWARKQPPSVLARLLDLLAAKLSAPDGFGPQSTLAFVRKQATELGALEAVTSLLLANRTSAAVCMGASRALSSLVEGSQPNASRVIELGVLTDLVSFIQAEVEVARWTCRALASMAGAGDACAREICASGAIATAVRTIPDDVGAVGMSCTLSEAVCRLLAEVCHIQEGVLAVVRAGGVGSMCRVLDMKQSHRATQMAALRVLESVAVAAKQRRGKGGKARVPSVSAPTMAALIAGSAPTVRADAPLREVRQNANAPTAFGANASTVLRAAGEATLQKQWEAQRVTIAPDVVVQSEDRSFYGETIAAILESLPPMTVAKAWTPVRKELESRMRLAPGSLLSEQAEIEREIRRVKEAKVEQRRGDTPLKERVPVTTLLSEAEARAASAISREVSLADEASSAVQRSEMGVCLLRTLNSAITASSMSRHDSRHLCAICACLEAVLAPNGALASESHRHDLIMQGAIVVLSRLMESAPHGELSNDFDGLPDRFETNCGASTNVIYRATRILSLLSPDG